MVKLLDLGLRLWWTSSRLCLQSDFQCYRITPSRTQNAQRRPHYLFIIAPKGGNFNENV